MKKTVILSTFKIEVVCFMREAWLFQVPDQTENKNPQEINKVILRMHGWGW